MTEPRAEAPAKRRTFKRFLLTGLATLLPTVLTGYIVFLFIRFVHNNFGRAIVTVLERVLGPYGPNEEWRHFFTVASGDILAVAIVLVAAVTAGAMTASFLGRRIIRAGEHLILKVPLVRVIYPYVKQVTDFLLTEKSLRFHTVVAVEYPRRGIYSIAFVTGQGMRSLSGPVGEGMVHVFIPSSPTPITGYVVFVKRSEVIELPISVDQALRFAISGGVIVPPHEMVEAAIEAGEGEPPRLAGPEEPTWAAKE